MIVWGLCLGKQVQAEHVVIGHVEIHGARAVSEEVLRKKLVMSTGGVFDSVLVRADIQRILMVYKDHGFWQATVGLPKVHVQDSRAQVIFDVREGVLTRVDSVGIQGDLAFDRADVQKALGLFSGVVLIEEYLDHRLQGLLQFYDNSGYPFCQLRPDVQFAQSHATVHVQVNAGPLVHVDTVYFEGNRISKPHVLLRQMAMKPGMVYRQHEVDQAVNRLRRLSFVQGVDRPELIKKKDGYVLLVRIQEARSARIDGGVGLSPGANGSGQKLTGVFLLDVQNVAGTGREGHVGWLRSGPGASDLVLRYREPWVLGGPVSGRAQLRFRERQGYSEREIGIGAEVVVGNGTTVFVDGVRSAVLPDSTGFGRFLTHDVWTFKVGGQLDRRDQVWNPHTGWMGQAQVAISRVTHTTGEEKRQQYAVLGWRFVPFASRSVLALGGQGHWVFQAGGVPEEARLRIGGSQSIRGYREEAFLATRAMWATAEWRLLLGGRSRVFVFVDAGLIDEKTRVFPVGYGLGLLMESAIGAIGMDLGLARGDSFDQARVHVRLVQAF